ncbi:ABC transporter ATP-binding protein [Fusibacter ferrireducens]|uniref:ABC transporter ATP-binding protein n=1 Tax=Fusibacter ferrireducens TaxID=2785058 RepID=A0ABR9ZMH0_9FIRM|nr:ABC transporter ATP-binding protein [Fusibacter ferrireducens]MBF4691660.1 ABC transporter ATP-binding protein [Fusibacter ferrireducens]
MSSSSLNFIEVQDLIKYFGDFKVLKGINLHVKQGSIYGLIGPNGAGKTTLIKHIVGSYYQDGGEVLIDGEPVYDNSRILKRMAYIPDDLYFNTTDTVKKISKFYKKIYPFFNEKRFETLKTVFEIDENHLIRKMSKGMKKQAAFWLAISSMPDILILDEPVDGLDPVTRRRVWSLILQDVEERGTTVLISSHNLRELEDVCDYVGILHNGSLLMEKDLDELKTDIHKIQTSFEFEPDSTKLNAGKILYENILGSVHNYIIKGDKDHILKWLNLYSPRFIDMLPLSLEEVFIYEIGGEGYEIKEIIL